MIISPDEQLALHRATELERPLAAVETQLSLLGDALRQQDLPAVDRAASDLHAALSAAVNHFVDAARSGGVPPLLRRRLAMAGGQVAAQREALARATASLDRAINVLIPDLPSGSGLYSASGGNDRGAVAGGLLA